MANTDRTAAAKRKPAGKKALFFQDAAKLQAALAAAIGEHDVPAASIAILHDGKVHEAAAGILNLATGVEATTDSVFQYGSITKTLVGTVIMRLVEAGRIELDAPVTRYLPEFITADREASAKMTVRHMLTHTSGLDGDTFVETGRGEDRYARHVHYLARIPQLHEVGKVFSYCNAGFVVLGRIIEVITGQPWEDAMQTLLFDPAGMNDVVLYPERVTRYRVAYGHLPDPETGKPKIAPASYLCLAQGPAGSLTTGSARSLISFARLHLNDGVSVTGQRVLGKKTARAMRTLQVPFRNNDREKGWGLSFGIYDRGKPEVFGHGGATIGQLAFMDILPDHDAAVVLLTNSMKGGKVYEAMTGEILRLIADARLAPPPEPVKNSKMDLTRYEGTYARIGSEVVFVARDGGLNAEIRSTLASPPQITQQRFLPARKNILVNADPNGTPTQIEFAERAGDGKPDYLRVGVRTLARAR